MPPRAPDPAGGRSARSPVDQMRAMKPFMGAEIERSYVCRDAIRSQGWHSSAAKSGTTKLETPPGGRHKRVLDCTGKMGERCPGCPEEWTRGGYSGFRREAPTRVLQL